MNNFVVEKAKEKQRQKEKENPLTIILREEWGALPSKELLPPLPHKPNNVSLCFNTKSDECNTKEDCIRVMKSIQKHDMEVDKQPDIEYNFLVGNDGNVYEGRGWKYKVPFLRKEPFPEYPDQTIEIALIGDYSEKNWPIKMLETAVALINHGIARHFVHASYNYV